MKVLLIVQEVPESIKFYLLPSVTEEEAKMLRKVHGKYLNGVADEASADSISCVLCAASEDKSGWKDDTGVPKEWKKKNWHQYLLPAEDKIQTLTGTMKMVVTGMFL